MKMVLCELCDQYDAVAVKVGQRAIIDAQNLLDPVVVRRARLRSIGLGRPLISLMSNGEPTGPRA
jgi:hypothetical protein